MRVKAKFKFVIFLQFKLKIIKNDILKQRVIEPEFCFLATLKADEFDASESEI